MRTHRWISFVLLGFVAALGASNVSCSTIECGQGTVERDGVCAPAEEAPDNAGCGPLTVLGPNGCEPEVPTVCDDATTEAQYDPETGITTCVGVGGGGCSGEISGCDAPDAGKATLCGRIWDAETDQPFIDPATTDAPMACDIANPTQTGACSLSLKFYDALNFATDPMLAVPLAAETFVLDSCGRYKGVNLPRATFGFIGIAVDDAMGTPDRHKLTGVATSNGFATPGREFRAYVTRNQTDETWTAGTGLTGSLSQRGVLAIVFKHRGAPVAGVQVRRNGSLIPNDDFYFTDTGISRSMVTSTPTVTGPNGTVLVVNSPQPITHDGVGAEPPNCRWPANLAASIAGVVFVQIKDAEINTGGTACP